MKTKISVITIGVILWFVGVAGAQQILLPGALIPKFVDQLPVAGGISVVNAMPDPVLGIPATPDYNIHLREFLSQILPSTGVPADPGTGFAGLPANTASHVWGYLTDDDLTGTFPRPSFLGPVVVAKRGTAAHPTYYNELPYPYSVVQANLPIDQTLDWANPLGDTGPDGCAPDANGNYTNLTCGMLPYTGPLPDSVHIHGGEVPPASDGGPDSWFTQDDPNTPGVPLYTGIAYPGKTLDYPNGQEEATIWFHPHGFGITRLNVYAGMAGVYEIMDPGGTSAPIPLMPQFPNFDIPLILQDRSFDTTGELFYNLASNPQPNPTVHPFWIPEFIGDVICVNGKTWPNLNVEPRQYRFRLLNGSNARFYDLTITKAGVPFLPFIAIATDDGYLATATRTSHILIAPGERYEVIVNFKNLPVGTKLVLKNSANTPYPGGDPVNPGTTDTVMQFTVVANASGLPDTNIANGTPIRQSALVSIIDGHDSATGSITRQLTLNEVIGAGGPLELVVNNSKYNLQNNGQILSGATSPGSQTVLNRETELPAVGDTEIWEIINITADAHPMHTHLTSFQLLDRTPFDAANYIAVYEALLAANGVLPGQGPPNLYNKMNADGAIGGNPPISTYLQVNNRRAPLPFEKGWKDTVIAYPGEVTRIAVRWAPQDAAVNDAAAGSNLYPFDPTALSGGVGYVWHCHILDHEDNEMMRNYTVGTQRQYIVANTVSADLNGDGCIGRADYTILMANLRSGGPAYDINGDGVVNIADARALVLQFANPGGVCP